MSLMIFEKSGSEVQKNQDYLFSLNLNSE